MGGFIQPDESPEACCNANSKITYRVLKVCTWNNFLHLANPARDPIERTLSITYFALIDIHRYEKQLSDEYHPGLVPVK